MDRISPVAASSRYPNAIPISYDDLIAAWEATINRVAAGEIFMLIKDETPVVYLVPVDRQRKAQEI